MRPLRRGKGTARPPRPLATPPDERIFGRHYRGPSPAKIGFVVLLVFVALAYLAFAKHIPFTGHGYELHATFQNAATLRPDSPVRIAGVNVGKVTDVSAKGSAAEVTFTVDDEGQPVHTDAEAEIRPRLFLEGNFFVDLRPGSPSAAELPDGGDIPITRTSTAVQLDEVLTSLQTDSRRDLQRLLEGYGTALTYEPTAADDADQDPDVQGETAAESINDSFRYGGPAGRDTAIVNEALLGEGPHDLSGLIRAQRTVFGKLAGHEEQLKGLITNFNTTVGALAAESGKLSASIRELAPTLEESQPALRHLSDALPPLRVLAIQLEPSIAELPGTIAAGEPWLEQTRLLLRDRELGGLASRLAETAPQLATTTHATLDLFPELRLVSRCVSEVLIPAGDIPVTADSDPDLRSTQPNYREFFYSTVNFSGESQGFDGNGSYVRFQSGGGPTLVQAPIAPGSSVSIFGNAIEAPDGVQPVLPQHRPPFRMDVPCHRNDVPNVNGPAAAAGPPDLTAVP